MVIQKTNEKAIITLFRSGKSYVWLAKLTDQTRQSISNKIRFNKLTEKEIVELQKLGMDDE